MMAGASLIDKLAAHVQYCGQTTAKLVVVALHDTGTVAVSCSGGSVSVGSVTSLGADNPAQPGVPVLFVWHVDVSGLTAGQRYDWTATKNGNTVTGSLRTMPADGQNYSYVMSTCEHHETASPANGMRLLREYIDAQESVVPVYWYTHIDDLLYADSDRSWGRPGFISGDTTTGLRVTVPEGTPDSDPQDTGLSWDYCVNWARYFGLLADSQYSNNADRLWVMRNIPLHAQWGDHEVASNWQRGYGGNDYWYGPHEWDGVVTEPDFLPVGTDDFFDNVAVPNWEALFGQARPSKLGTGQHWGYTVGPVCFVALDMNTFADGRHGMTIGTGSGTGRQADGTINAGTGDATLPYLGTQQITDVLTYIQAADKPFNVIYASNGISSHNEPWGQWWCTDFDDLMTRTTIGLLNNPRTNGTTGKAVILKGDTHALHVVSYHSDGTAGGLGGSSHTGKELWEICPGTINGSSTARVNFPYPIYREKTRLVKDGASSNKRKIHGFVHVTVFAAESPQRVEIKLIETTSGYSQAIWTGQWRSDVAGNAFIAPDAARVG